MSTLKRTPNIYPRRVTLTESWSSKQQLSLEDLLCLANDLVNLYTKLVNSDSNLPEYTKIYKSMTLATIYKNIRNDILISQENG